MKISTREKWLLAVLVIAGLTYLIATYIWAPNHDIKVTLEQERDTLTAKINELHNAEEVESNLDQQIQDTYDKIGAVAKNYFTTTQQEELILLVNDLFDVEDLRIETVSFPAGTPEVINNAEFLNTDIEISFSGNYTSLMNILDSVWAFPKAMHVKNLNLNMIDTADGTVDATGVTYQDVTTVDNTGLTVQTDTTTTETTTTTDTTVTGENTTTVNNEASNTSNEPVVNVNGTMTLELAFFTMDSGTVDALYTWYIDEQYTKSNPFIAYEKANATIRYIFTGEGANLFNFDRFKKFNDIQGHWMEDEIQAFLEAGYIFTNNYATFGPDQPITRGEFVVLLDSVYQWTGESDMTIDITKFKDYDSFSNLDSTYAKAIQKGIQRGYIEGYDNNTIGLSSPITYGEVELIMRRISQNNDFQWSDVASDISNKKSITSTRWSDMNATMTKAEAVYVLTYFK